MDQAKKEYEDLRQLGPASGVSPNYQQADPYNVLVPWGPAGYTLRDMMGSQGKGCDVMTAK